jgi:hypothetical protein
LSIRITTSRAPPVADAASGCRRKNGRENAATISASAARRSSNSGQFRIRRR